jgi:tyrosyl-tRNA synthetase
MTPDKATQTLDYVLARGVIDIIPKGSLNKALESGKKLRLKFGLDPSKPDLHIGHAVLLRKLRTLQEMGHQVVLIVGDWTAQIVDKAKTEVRWQSEWFDDFKLDDVMRLTGRFTVAQMLQREDFRQRFDAKQALGIHELLYPLLQAYDSVAINADVEFGGTDQLFNMLVGRELQQEMGQEPQIVLTMNLLVGTDGSQKMSKSLGNTIDLEDPPGEQFGKVMSIPDEALMGYLELATDLPDEELIFIAKQLDEKKINPMDVKKRLARDIVQQFHGDKAAEGAEGEFGRVFQKRETPENMEEIPMADLADYATDDADKFDLPHLLHDKGLAPSVAEARRLIKQGAVHVLEGPGEGVVRNPRAELATGSVLRIGKHRFLKVVDAT